MREATRCGKGKVLWYLTVLCIFLGVIITLVGYFGKATWDGEADECSTLCKQWKTRTGRDLANCRIAGPILLIIGGLLVIYSVCKRHRRKNKTGFKWYVRPENKTPSTGPAQGFSNFCVSDLDKDSNSSFQNGKSRQPGMDSTPCVGNSDQLADGKSVRDGYESLTTRGITEIPMHPGTLPAHNRSESNSRGISTRHGSCRLSSNDHRPQSQDKDIVRESAARQGSILPCIPTFVPGITESKATSRTCLLGTNQPEGQYQLYSQTATPTKLDIVNGHSMPQPRQTQRRSLDIPRKGSEGLGGMPTEAKVFSDSCCNLRSCESCESTC